ncbi:MAG: hypothetical protein KJ077_11055 [Anaerolineae bacterium]|nr:hypothetical protein [Anaerolineae bacterium]
MITQRDLQRYADQIKKKAWDQTFYDFRGPEETNEEQLNLIRQLTDEGVTAPNRLTLYYRKQDDRLAIVVGRGAMMDSCDVVLHLLDEQPTEFLYNGRDRNRFAAQAPSKKFKTKTFTSYSRNGDWTLSH